MIEPVSEGCGNSPPLLDRGFGVAMSPRRCLLGSIQGLTIHLTSTHCTDGGREKAVGSSDRSTSDIRLVLEYGLSLFAL